MDSRYIPEKQPAIEDHINVSILLVDDSRRVLKLCTADPEKHPAPPENLTGRLPGEALGCKNALEHPGKCGRTETCGYCQINKAIREALENGDHRIRKKARFTRKQGNIIEQVSLLVSAASARDDEKTAILCIQDLTELEKLLYEIQERTDITEEKKAGQEREQLEHRLRHSQKMEAVGELSGGIAHEFNNLLQIINGYADLMTDDIDTSHPARSRLEEIRTAGDRATKLVRNLLAFSSRQIMQMMDIRINDQISKTVHMLRNLLGENIEIDFIPGRNLGLVNADPNQIEQVLVNLCVNARDAMPEGGTITIETENILINGQYCRTHDWAQPGRFVLISVSDTGSGMDAYTSSRAYEPFFTTKPPEKSHGLGLATAYGIIRQHEGMINVYSEPGQGTLFKIYLPIVERRASEVGVSLRGKVLGGSETILIAEDDEMVCDLMQTVLSRAGYRTICTRDGQKAVEAFESSMDDIDLAVLDVVMPEKNGREASDAIKKLKPETKVLFCSGYSTNAIHTNFVLHKKTELLQKPFTADELLRKVRELLDSDT
ncbi:MAG: ATP-binding protein [Desulfobacterales bacterium]